MIEKLESEIKLLNKDVNDYKCKLTVLNKEKDELLLEQEKLKSHSVESQQSSSSADQKSVSKVSVECQTTESNNPDAALELSELLKLTVQHCLQLDEQLLKLPQFVTPTAEGEKQTESNLKV